MHRENLGRAQDAADLQPISLDVLREKGIGQDFVDFALRIAKALDAFRLDDHVGEKAVQLGAKLLAEAAHDAVDDDERRYAKGDGDDARQGEEAGAEVSPTEEKFVHRVGFQGLRAGQLAGC